MFFRKRNIAIARATTSDVFNIPQISPFSNLYIIPDRPNIMVWGAILLNVILNFLLLLWNCLAFH